MKKSRFNVEISNQNGYAIVNTMTAAIVCFSKNEWGLFSENKLPPETQSILYEKGILIDDSLDEIGLLRNAYRQMQSDLQSARITICPTLECNFACPYCYEQRIPGKMSDNIQESVLHEIEKIFDLGIDVLHITWYGGEPLLCRDIVMDMSYRIKQISSNKKKDCRFNIITNGYYIDESIISFFQSIKINSIQITVDGCEEVHNQRRISRDGKPTFQRIVDNIKLLDQSGLSVNVRINIDKNNINQFEKVKQLFKNCQNVLCYPAFITEETIQSKAQKDRCIPHNEYGHLYNQQALELEKIDLDKVLKPGISICMAEHRYSCVFTPDGNIYKCINDVCNPKLAVGSVTNKETISPTAISRYLGRDPFTENECISCKFLPVCYGRCVWEYCDKGTHACPDIRYLLEDIVTIQFLNKEVIE